MNIYISGGGHRRGQGRPPNNNKCEVAFWNQLWAIALQGLAIFIIFAIGYVITAIIIGVILYLLHLWMNNRRRRLGGNRSQSRLLDLNNMLHKEIVS